MEDKEKEGRDRRPKIEGERQRGQKERITRGGETQEKQR
jgi:hypothetical protein